jgi:peptidoglycan-N-acetylglucosamine deacetylase
MNGFNSLLVLFTLMIIGLGIYTVIPDMFLHRLGIGSFKRQYGPGVSLTIDDGPDPYFTPRILEILDYYQVKATFFLVGEKAQRYPDLVRQILEKGHTVGAHSQHHSLSWKMSPWMTWREWQQNLTILEHLTCKKVDWIRPPWGTFNLALYCWMIKSKKKAVLWNAQGQDWRVMRTPEEITSRILNNIRQGSIILLHDSGGEIGAPENSIQALNLICQKVIMEFKLPILPLEFPEWSWRRRFAFVLWEKWEYIYANLFHVRRINATNLFRLTKKRYKGPDLYDSNGNLLATKGDTVAEIHLDSIRFQIKETDSHNIGLKALSQVRQSLPVLAQYIAESHDYQDIKVLLGLTLLNRGVKRLGFEVQEVPSTWVNRKIGMLQKVIISVYHPLGIARNTKRLGNKPKIVWISRQKLLECWLPQKEEASIDNMGLEIGQTIG